MFQSGRPLSHKKNEEPKGGIYSHEAKTREYTPNLWEKERLASRRATVILKVPVAGDLWGCGSTNIRFITSMLYGSRGLPEFVSITGKENNRNKM